MSCSEVMYQYYPYLYQRPPPPHPHAGPHPSVAHAAAAAAAANPHTAHHSPARPAPFQPFSAATPSHQYDRINVNQRSLETTSLELCGAASVASGPTGGGGGGTSSGASGAAVAAAAAAAIQAAAVAGVPQGQSSSTGSIGSAPSPASPRPNASQHRPPLSGSAQASRSIDDDRSTDVGPNTATDDSDDNESRAQYVSANCVVFTHYRGDAASEVEEHFQRALAQDKPKDNNNPMISRNFPASFWKSHHDVYEYADPWHSHYPQYHPRSVHEYHHHHNMANMASYNSLLLNRSLAGHPTSHPGVAHHAHSAATYKDWTAATPTQSLVDASSAPPYPHGPYAPLSSDYWT